MSLLSHDELISLLAYDHINGKFYWVNGNKRVKKNGIAGHKMSDGYIRIIINGIQYKAHRLSWFYMTKEWPKSQIDHINRNKSDNSWKNLRCVSGSENMTNTGIRSDNTSGTKGVYWHKTKNRWIVQITINKRKLQIGRYKDFELASLVSEEARIKYHQLLYI